jgi:hypothetical protein
LPSCLICRADVRSGVQSSFSGLCRTCIQFMPCWRCGKPAGGYWPYLLCGPCVDVVSEEDVAWLNDRTNQPDKRSWELVPLGRPQGR